MNLLLLATKYRQNAISPYKLYINFFFFTFVPHILHNLYFNFSLLSPFLKKKRKGMQVKITKSTVGESKIKVKVEGGKNQEKKEGQRLQKNNCKRQTIKTKHIG